jgi:hypothetical protein
MRETQARLNDMKLKYLTRIEANRSFYLTDMPTPDPDPEPPSMAKAV